MSFFQATDKRDEFKADMKLLTTDTQAQQFHREMGGNQKHKGEAMTASEAISADLLVKRERILDEHKSDREAMCSELAAITKEIGRPINPYFNMVESGERVSIETLGDYLYSARCHQTVYRDKQGGAVRVTQSMQDNRPLATYRCNCCGTHHYAEQMVWSEKRGLYVCHPCDPDGTPNLADVNLWRGPIQ